MCTEGWRKYDSSFGILQPIAARMADHSYPNVSPRVLRADLFPIAWNGLRHAFPPAVIHSQRVPCLVDTHVAGGLGQSGMSQVWPKKLAEYLKLRHRRCGNRDREPAVAALQSMEVEFGHFLPKETTSIKFNAPLIHFELRGSAAPLATRICASILRFNHSLLIGSCHA